MCSTWSWAAGPLSSRAPARPCAAPSRRSARRAGDRSRRGSGRRSEFDVQTRGEEVDGTAILVVSGIADELVVEAQRHRLDHAIAVVSLDDALGRVVETPVADEDAGPAGGEEIAMRFGEL